MDKSLHFSWQGFFSEVVCYGLLPREEDRFGISQNQLLVSKCKQKCRIIFLKTTIEGGTLSRCAALDLHDVTTSTRQNEKKHHRKAKLLFNNKDLCDFERVIPCTIHLHLLQV